MNEETKTNQGYIRKMAAKHDLHVVTRKEKMYYEELLRAMKRAKVKLDLFNVAFFGESERGIDQVIADLKHFTYEVNGTRQSRISMLLEELKERRQHDSGRKTTETSQTANHETSQQSPVLPTQKGAAPQDASGQRLCPPDSLGERHTIPATEKQIINQKERDYSK